MNHTTAHHPPCRQAAMLRCRCRCRVGLFLLGMFLLSPTSLSARSSQKSRVADTSSPRATLFSFIEACNELQQVIKTDRKFDRSDPKHHWLGLRILDCLDYSQLPDFVREDRAAEVASCLKEIIDRTDPAAVREDPGCRSDRRSL